MAPKKGKGKAPEPEPEPEPEPAPAEAEEDGYDCDDRIDDTGHGVVRYPSGEIAVNSSIGDVSKGGPAITQLTFMADSAKPKILVSFDQNGEGFVNYANGKPWLLVNRLTGYQVSDENGNIVMKGGWPRKDATPVVCQVTDAIRVEFIDRQHISASFELMNVRRDFQCGEQLKRTSTYLDKSTGTSPIATLRGKHELDAAEIRREHAEAGGSLYHRPGPHAQKTKLSGVGVLKTLTKELPQDSEAITIMNGLEDAMQRMTQVTTLPGATLSKSIKEPLDDMGSPPMSDEMKKMKQTNFSRRSNLQNWYNLDAKYTPKRKKVPQISLKKYHEVTNTAPPSKVLVVICFTASWSPMSKKHEGPIELAWGQLQTSAAKDALCQDAMVHVYRLDASEASSIQKKYQFRTVPMYMHFFDGNLVAATNVFKGTDYFLQQIRASQDMGARGTFLPSTFAFGLKDNCELDHITTSMSLVNA